MAKAHKAPDPAATTRTDENRKEIGSEQNVNENPPPHRREGSPEEMANQYEFEDQEMAKAIEGRQRAYENPPSRGRRRALAADGQYGTEYSAFSKMIAAKRRVEEVPPPRGGKRVRIRQTESGSYAPPGVRETSL
jgi:hypothetical protein